MQLINIGYGNMLASERVVAVVAPEAAPVRRMIQDSRDRGRVIDATCGHKTKAAVIMDSDHIILSPLLPETIAGRMNNSRKESVQE